MEPIRKSILLVILSILTTVATAADQTVGHADDRADNQGVEQLSGELRSLLKAEMVALDAAMKDLVSLNASGDYVKISQIARQVKDSFILKQSLTRPQMHELHSKLSSDFIEQDQQFHYYAGMLEHAAENKKSELVAFYYSRLFEACSSCHKAHARHKFTLFDSNQTEDHNH